MKRLVLLFSTLLLLAALLTPALAKAETIKEICLATCDEAEALCMSRATERLPWSTRSVLEDACNYGWIACINFCRRNAADVPPPKE
jgi:hypothetical protein